MISPQTTGNAKPADLFSAGEIARCLGCTPQAVRKKLRAVPATGVLCIKGQETAAWSIDSLPEKLKADLQCVAQARGYRWLVEMLRNPPKPEGCGLKLSEIDAAGIAYAKNLRAALKPALSQQTNLEVTSAELETAAAREFQNQFGYNITERHVRNLIKRVLKNDGGREDWDRLESYLPKHPRPKESAKTPRVVSAAVKLDFPEISEYIESCKDRSNPNATERNGIWTLAFQKHDELTGEGLHHKAASRRVRDFLFSCAPFLSLAKDGKPSREGLLKAFERKFSAWAKSGRDAKALRDGRAENTGNLDGYEFPENDKQLLTNRAVCGFGGRIAQAWRDLLSHGQFSAETQARYAGKARSKSHVPHSIMESVRADVEYMTLIHRGPRAWDSAKGFVSRDYSTVASLDVMQGDDVTLPVYFYVPSGNGFKLIRGQCLIFICARSLRVLGYSLQPDPNYNSLVIRSQCVRLFAEFGPPKILYFERGLWKRAKLVNGSARSFGEVSQGLKEFGIEFQHAIRPRSKVVERVIGMLQNLMEGEPGYCGRRERDDAPEILRKRMLDVESGRALPSEHFYSFEQLNERLPQIIEQYNNEPQQGKMLSSLSPEQALEKFQNPDDPRIDFTPQIQYLLAYHKVETNCGTNGVTITLRGQSLNYKGAELAHLTGKRVLVWLDPENTETAVVTDLERSPESFARVQRSQSVNPFARDEQSRLVLANQLRRVDEQVAPIKTRYNIIKQKFSIPKRTTLVDGQTLELGRRFAEDDQRRETQNRVAKNDARETARLGLSVPIKGSLDERARKELEELDSL